MESSSPPRVAGWVKVSLLLFLAALHASILHYRATTRQVANTVESRVAITAREMVRSGDWVVPRLNGQLRLEKPPLPYWLAASSATVSGVFDDRALRLPFALLSVLVVCLAAMTGAILWGWETGVLSAVVLLGSALFVKESGLATADITLLACATAAWYFHARARVRPGRSGRSRFLFWVSLGLGAMAKGPPVLALVILPIIVEAALRRSREPLRALWSPAGILAFVVLALFWPALVISRLESVPGEGSPIARWVRESFGKVAAVEDADEVRAYSHHPGPWHFYLPRLFSAFGPWTIALPFALWLGALRLRRPGEGRGRRRRTAAAAPFVQFATILIFFSIVREKKLSYMLPIVVPGALLVARALSRSWPGFRNFALTPARILASLAAVGSLALVAVTVVRPDLLGAPAGPLLLLAGATFAGAAGLWLTVGSESALLPFLFVGTAFAVASVPYSVLRLSEDPDSGAFREAGAALAAEIPAGTEVTAFGRVPLPILWYLDREVREVPADDPRAIDGLSTGSPVLMTASRARGFLLDPAAEPWDVVGIYNRESERQRETTFLLRKRS